MKKEEEKLIYVITTFPNHEPVPIKYKDDKYPTVFLNEKKAEKEAERLNKIPARWGQKMALFMLGQDYIKRYKVIKYRLNEKKA